MPLTLDSRQRAMLLEMGVRVWLPGTEFAQADSTRPDAAPMAPVRAATQRTAALAALPPTPAPIPVQAPVRPSTRFAAPSAVSSSAPPGPPNAGASVRVSTSSAGLALSADLAGADWAGLAQTAATCQACDLCSGRHRSCLVPPLSAPATGSLAHWMVVGDAPDEEEDAAGVAFAGQAGVLLGNMLKALQLQRINPLPGDAAASPHGTSAARNAYVTNVVKCRPPHGRLPQAADLAQCSAYLQREIALVQPRMILAMGRFANQLLLGESPALATQPLGKLRGSVRHFAGIPVVVTYHPKALLRNSADKAKAWADLCLAADMLDAAHPG